MSELYTTFLDGNITPFDAYIEQELFNERIVYLDSDIDDCKLNEVIKRLKVLSKQSKKPITLIINTDGGCIYGVLRLCDVIRRLRAPVDLQVEGKAFSGGAYILGIVGRRRTANRNASFMLHEISSDSYGKITDQDIDLTESKRLQKILVTHLKRRCSLSDEVIAKFTDGKDWYFNAFTAKKIGLIDRVV